MSAAQRTPLLAVKSKEGELQALLNTTEVNDRVQVMVELLDSVSSDGSVIKKVVNFCVASASRGRPVWVDTTWLTRASDLGASPRAVLERLEHDIEENSGLFSTCSEQPCLIPVVSLSTDDEGLRAIRMFLEHRRRPVVVRARRPSLPTAELLRTLDRIATTLRLGTDEMHLVFDEGYVRKLETHRVDALVDNITGLANRNEYASVSVLAGSSPRERGDYETHLRQRVEVELWKVVQEASGKRIRYGDYGVVHPDPQKSREGWGLPNPYIHYTVPGATLSIARQIPERKGNSVPPGSAERYFLQVADELVRRPEFAGADFSWGDRNLYTCRKRPNPQVGSASKWIAFATSHHATHVSRSLDVP
ncbi:beta family protein [Saccharomonospora sp.]|uniref:beta family protein n=1 Tax=Saccharomonospora sp. TaxID=33913 RepID=UPI00260C143D|nr:beta family protein [Saccharomonospora sp.]